MNAQSIIHIMAIAFVLFAVYENHRFRRQIKKATDELIEQRYLVLCHMLRDIINDSIKREDYELAERAKDLLNSIIQQDGTITISKTK